MITRKLVTIESCGKLDALGGINGPITSPCYLDIKLIIQLINSGKIVFEVNPQNHQEKTRLTNKNVTDRLYTTKVSPKNVVRKEDIPESENANAFKFDISNRVNQSIALDVFASNKYS